MKEYIRVLNISHDGNKQRKTYSEMGMQVKQAFPHLQGRKIRKYMPACKCAPVKQRVLLTPSGEDLGSKFIGNASLQTIPAA